MKDVFISYSWKDREIANQTILPLLQAHGVSYFIDHENFDLESEGDSTIAQYLAERGLERLYKTAVLKPWENAAPVGKPVRELPARIESAIANTRVHLVLMSQHAALSFWVAREVDFSLSLCRKLVVIRLDNAPMPERLATLVNAQLIPCVSFTGESQTPAPVLPAEHFQGFYSNEPAVRQQAETRDRYLRHGVVYRASTESDHGAVLNEVSRLLACPPFNPAQIAVEQNSFSVSGVTFEFVTLRGAVFLGRLSLLKFPITVQQYDLLRSEVADPDTPEWRPPGAETNARMPATYMSWHEAQRYASVLAERAGQKLRLPYEVEWEFACRAGSAAAYCFGEDESQLHEYAWVDQSEPRPVGIKRPNRWGFHDMHGNVGEWCADILDVGEVYAIQSPRTCGKVRVIRGGAGFMEAHSCRSGFRYYDTPESRGFQRGFRLCWRQTGELQHG